MKERVKVMQDMYENRSTNKKAAGCTVIISGEIKDVMDKITAPVVNILNYQCTSRGNKNFYEK